MDSQETKEHLEAELAVLEKRFMHLIEQKARATDGEVRELVGKQSDRLWNEIREIQRKLAEL